MIDFLKLTIKYLENQSYSFVGLAKSDENILFYVPKGIKKYFELNDCYEGKKNLFFLLYRTFKKFIFLGKDRGYIHKNKINNRDGVINLEFGSGEGLDSGEPITLYNKLNFLDSLLEQYDELKIISLVYRLGSIEPIEYDRIYSNLHLANFLDNGAIYLDTMNYSRPVIHFEQTDIIDLYCYLLTEVKYQLEEEVSSKVKSLAERYKEKYLHSDSSLFNQNSYPQTLDLVIESLEYIDIKTVYKDSDYWDFYEAIEKFLYTDFDRQVDGEIWGINNFHNVWESACLFYLLKINSTENILFLDTKYLPQNKIYEYQLANQIFNINSKVFKIQIENSQKSLRPDAILIKEEQSSDRKNYNYKLYRDKWNHDYTWFTQFEYIIHSSKTYLDIGFKGQQRNQEIIDLLEKHFSSSKNIPNYIKSINKHIYKSILIDKKLPDNFFSYWNIPRELTKNDLRMMRHFNHVFYQAFFEEGLKTSEDFIDNFSLKEENIIQSIGSSYFGFDKDKYDYFLVSLYKLFSLEIVDFQYISEEEIKNQENIEECKSSSIRKQFVYEYLLNEYLVKQEQIKEPKISSCFWIPAYNSGENVLVSGDKYLDGYLDLALVDPIKLLQHYVQ